MMGGWNSWEGAHASPCPTERIAGKVGMEPEVVVLQARRAGMFVEEFHQEPPRAPFGATYRSYEPCNYKAPSVPIELSRRYGFPFCRTRNSGNSSFAGKFVLVIGFDVPAVSFSITNYEHEHE